MREDQKWPEIKLRIFLVKEKKKAVKIMAEKIVDGEKNSAFFYASEEKKWIIFWSLYFFD